MASASQPIPRTAARTRAGRAVDARAEYPPFEPPRAGLIATLVFAAATLLLGAPALAGKFLVNTRSDQFIAGYAFREFAAQSLRSGHGFPLWNPYLFGGMPYVAAMHGDEFYPPSLLLRLILPTDKAMTWEFILHIFLAGVFAYAFLRGALRLSFFAALVGGLAYMLGGNVAGLVSPGHDGKLYLAALLPLVLLITHRLIVDGRRWAIGALALAVTFAILTPHPQLLQYLLLTAGAYALFVAFARHGDAPGVRLERRAVVQRLAVAAGAIAVGFLGSAVQYWPVLEYTPWSPRAGGKGYDHATSFSFPPEEIINTYLPQFSGILDAYTGRNGIHYHSEYIGAAVLVLAGSAYFARGVIRRQLWFWTGTFVVTLLWALGGYTPFFNLVYVLVPGTNYFRAPSTILYVVSFCTAVLAAIGTDAATRRRISARYVVAWIGVAAGLALLATSGALSNLAASFAYPQLAPRVDANAGALTLGAWRSLVAVAAAAGALLTLAGGRQRAAGWALAGGVALDLWSIERSYWQFSPPATELYAPDAAVSYLAGLSQPARVAPLAAGEIDLSRDPYFGHDGAGRATGFMVHGIRSIAGYHGNELGRWLTFSGWSDNDVAGDWPRELGNPNFRRLTNLQYLYSNSPQAPDSTMARVAGPARNAAGNMVYLYRFPESNPYAWVAPIAIKAPDTNVVATVLDPRFDVGRAALFDTSARVNAQPVPPQLPAPLDLTTHVTRYEPGRVDLTLSRPAPAGAALVVSENYYPGWTATVDGRAVAVGRADYVLTGVELPAGAQRVSLQFTSPRYERGLQISLLALLASLGAFVAGLVGDRRRAASGSPV